MAWGGKRAGAGRKIGSMAGLAPLLVRTLQGLPCENATELLEELRTAVARLSRAGPRQPEMAKAITAALREANLE